MFEYMMVADNRELIDCAWEGYDRGPGLGEMDNEAETNITQ